MYLHFQKKKPNIKINNCETRYLIGEKGLIKFENVNQDIIKKYNNNKGQLYEKFEVIIYYIKKVYSFIIMNNKQKEIWIKQKRNKVNI